MFGLIIAVLYALVQLVMGNSNPYSIFLNCTNFLFWWYVITTIAIAPIYFGFAKLFGMIFTGRVARALLTVFVLTRGGLILGSYLIYHSLSFTNGEYHWNLIMLVAGIVLIIWLTRGGKLLLKINNRKWNLNI